MRVEAKSAVVDMVVDLVADLVVEGVAGVMSAAAMAAGDLEAEGLEEADLAVVNTVVGAVGHKQARK